jgi:GTP-binding protein HflX
VVDRVLASRGGVAVSAATGEGLERLRGAIDAALRPPDGAVRLRIPHGDGAALALCYERGRVVARGDDSEHVELTVELPPGVRSALAQYQV